jgi:hypothetical protein
MLLTERFISTGCQSAHMKKINKFLYWAPRIMGILFVCFLALFSLDVFEEGRSAGEIAIGLLMHNIPSLVLLAVLIVSWKYEIVGGIVFTLAGLAYISLVIPRSSSADSIPWYIALSWSLTIAGPALITGILFFLNWRMKRK